MSEGKRDDGQPADAFALSKVDFDALAKNLSAIVDASGKMQAAVIRPEDIPPRPRTLVGDELQEAVKTLGKVAQSYLSHPEKALEAQTRLTSGYVELWAEALRRMQGEAAAETVPARDKRFADPEWTANPFFDFMRRAYLHTAAWADEIVRKADDGIDEHTRRKAEFYVRQLASAFSPSNFVLTNPELLRTTLTESGANLARGYQMLAEDVEQGHGSLKIRQSDGSKFEVGVNIAVTPGKVVFRNDLIELLQYAPSTATVLKRPLLIVPPWINKFYILDLNAQKSFIRWAVEQGLTVFCISWVNPDERHREKGWEEYMREGILAALEAIEKQTGRKKVSAIGYCVGGTLLAATLSWMAVKKDDRIESATFFTTQVDFSDPGELQVFVDEEQVSAVEAEMAGRGYLQGGKMAMAFNMLRPNDLIWSYMINVYMKGNKPMPFDLLYWNSDSTNMPEKNHSYYLRNCYLDNNLAKGKMKLAGVKLDMGKITIPIYNLAAKEDHIAPAPSVFRGCSLFGGPVEYVQAGSGHIAGVVNPPAGGKYQYWTGGPPKGKLEDWMKTAKETPGSWWPHWFKWIEAQAPKRVDAAERNPAKGKLKVLGDAPGTYVRVKA